MRHMFLFGFMCATMAISACANAQQSTSDRPERSGPSNEQSERRGPPPEAFEACASKAAESVCIVTTPKGDDLIGICQMPKGDKLVCVPKQDKRH